jgi:TatD DNase family protein
VIDLHAHLDLYPHPAEVITECAEREMFVLSVTNTPSAWERTSALAVDFPRIRTALGLHPQLAGERRHELPLFDELISKVRYVGEIGLDGAPENRKSWQDQIHIFEHILSTCEREGGKIMTIHSRRAATAVLDHLERHEGAGIAILHWFSGSLKELRRAIDAGCWFSVGPGMVASPAGLRLVREMPKERVLTESDGPFTRVAEQSAWPWDVAIVSRSLSDIWKCDLPDVDRQLRTNLYTLLS